MYGGRNAIFFLDGFHYFGGYSYGYNTARQTLQISATSPDYDAFVYKYLFNHDNSYNCIYESVVSPRNFMSVQVPKNNTSGLAAYNVYQIFPQSTIFSEKLITTYTDDSDLNKIQTSNYFIPYASKFAGGFPLLDTMRIPRPCAFKSFNLTAMNYYRGMDSTQYNIASQNNIGYVVSMMDKDSTMVF